MQGFTYSQPTAQEGNKATNPMPPTDFIHRSPRTHFTGDHSVYRDVGEVTAHSLILPSLCLRHSSFSNHSFAFPTSQALHLIITIIMSSAHSPTSPSHHLRHSSFSNPSVASPTSQFIVQPFFRFSYVRSSSLNYNDYNELCSFSNLSVTSPTSQLILQSFRRFTYITARSPTLPLLHLRHSSFSNPFASSTSQALHLIHLASRPCETAVKKTLLPVIQNTLPIEIKLSQIKTLTLADPRVHIQ